MVLRDVKEPGQATVQLVMTTMPRGPDEIAGGVIDRARRGDEEAFAAIIGHYDPGLRALAFRLLGDRDRMDDALQEAYVRAYRALPNFRGQSKLGTWLYRIVYNACLDELRARRVVHLPFAEVGDPLDPSPGPEERAGLQGALADALAALPTEDRAAVLLVDLHGLDYRDAGHVLGIPPGTVASRLNRARGVLRRALGGEREVSEG